MLVTSLYLLAACNDLPAGDTGEVANALVSDFRPYDADRPLAEDTGDSAEPVGDNLPGMEPQVACVGLYGTVMDNLWGINALRNGDSGACTGTGDGIYQCVEFTDRVHPVTKSHIGNANTYDDGTNARKMGMYQFANGALKPLAGDICVSNGGAYGHVGVVHSCAVATCTMIDQNFSSIDATRDVTLAGNTLGAYSVSYTIAACLRPGWDLSNAIDTVAKVYGMTLTNATITAVDATGVTLNPGLDPQLKSPAALSLNATKYKKLRLRMASKAPDSEVKVYWTTTTDAVWNETKSKTAVTLLGGVGNEVLVDLGADTDWKGTVSQIRLDPAKNGDAALSTDTIQIDWIRFE